MEQERIFPAGFRWGTATAAHQVEGGNWNNDWWAWEHAPDSPCVEPSGDACDHFHRYPSDIALLAELGFGEYRYSLEWSRIEPEAGEFSASALGHYRRMAETCRANGIEPTVTFHHFTSPRWVAADGGWTNPETANRFARFCEYAAAGLAGVVDRVCTINEPNMVATLGWLVGIFPPGRRDRELRDRANEVFVTAHRLGREAIKSIAPDMAVGLTLAMSDFQAVEGGEEMIPLLRGPMEDPFLEAARGDDFFGVQTYSRQRIGRDGYQGPEPGVETTLMGYEFWPEALEATIRRAWKVTGVPIHVTENGVAVTDDTRRIAFVRRALEGVLRCLDDGIPVTGYTYWSTLDNFEWALGYDPTFGLIGVDRVTQERSVKPSGRWLGRVARANALGAV